MLEMDLYGFYTGKIFDTYQYLGAKVCEHGTVFRTFAPNAERVAIIGEFNQWQETPMEKICDGNFYECWVPEANAGQRYKIRVYEKRGRFIDHADPYGYGMECRPNNCSIIRNLQEYQFFDSKWMKNRTDGKDKAVNIYEVHLGSWRTKKEKQGESIEQTWFRYEEITEELISYVKENGYNYIELMPLCEYPCDESWGYQALGFYSPTARYGDMNGLKYLIDMCHRQEIGVILDFAPVHFAVDDYGLAEFDGTPLYEYPHRDIAYNEWGSKNFMHSRGEVRSFLQSAAMYWLKEYHFDGIRMDAISNMIYWQGKKERGVNQDAVRFIQYMNQEIKRAIPAVMLIAEDSTSYPNVTVSVAEGGLGFDYKWDMGWMNDTLEYFRGDSNDRRRDYYKLHFSMHYYYSERFLLPLSHDEVVHGKATILQKMNGQYEDKFSQARAFYMYMFAHPGKKLNFMGNEIGQFREWDEKREQDWNLLTYPIHDAFHRFMMELNHIYKNYPELYECDYFNKGFIWVDEKSQERVTYAFLRTGNVDGKSILAVFNFSDVDIFDYKCQFTKEYKGRLLLNSNWEVFGGNEKREEVFVETNEREISMKLPAFSGKYFVLEEK